MCALVTGVQTCALPICTEPQERPQVHRPSVLRRKIEECPPAPGHHILLDGTGLDLAPGRRHYKLHRIFRLEILEPPRSEIEDEPPPGALRYRSRPRRMHTPARRMIREALREDHPVLEIQHVLRLGGFGRYPARADIVVFHEFRW